MAVGYADDEDKAEIICTCGWETMGFPSNVIEEYVDHRIDAYRGVL